MAPHLIFIPFLFALGACVGSFLNVVVWRMPRGESLVSPPSHCPRCNHRLAWYDNVPVLGWIWLRGKCRYCGEPISARYPVVEAVTGLLFVFHYVMFFIVQQGPCPPVTPAYINEWSEVVQGGRPLSIYLDWPIFGLYLFLLSCLLAASLIDAELFIIPIEIPWLAAAAGVLVHGFVDRPSLPGALNVSPLPAAIAAGGASGLIVSVLLLKFRVIPQSFADGGPPLEVHREQAAGQKLGILQGSDPPPEQVFPEYTKPQLRAEMRKEMLFLMPPMLGAGLWLLLCWQVEPIASIWQRWAGHDWVSGGLGAVLGALVGAFVVWITRILGTLGFGREAMGMGDVHLMFGVGAVIGAGGSTVAFFLAPFFGIVLAVYMLISRRRRELPYGPYLSMATAFVMLFYCPIADYIGPGFAGLGELLKQAVGGGAG